MLYNITIRHSIQARTAIFKIIVPYSISARNELIKYREPQKSKQFCRNWWAFVKYFIRIESHINFSNGYESKRLFGSGKHLAAAAAAYNPQTINLVLMSKPRYRNVIQAVLEKTVVFLRRWPENEKNCVVWNITDPILKKREKKIRKPNLRLLCVFSF